MFAQSTAFELGQTVGYSIIPIAIVVVLLVVLTRSASSKQPSAGEPAAPQGAEPAGEAARPNQSYRFLRILLGVILFFLVANMVFKMATIRVGPGEASAQDVPVPILPETFRGTEPLSTQIATDFREDTLAGVRQMSVTPNAELYGAKQVPVYGIAVYAGLGSEADTREASDQFWAGMVEGVEPQGGTIEVGSEQTVEETGVTYGCVDVTLNVPIQLCRWVEPGTFGVVTIFKEARDPIQITREAHDSVTG